MINPIIALLILLIIAFFHVQCLAASSVNVPLDSWAYSALEKLEAYGLVESAMPATRPYSRLEAARLITEASRKWSKAAARKNPSSFAEKELIPELLKRLKD